MNRWLIAALLGLLIAASWQLDDTEAAQATALDLNDAKAAAVVAWKESK